LLKRFFSKTYEFEFNNKTFRTFDENLKPSLLGKAGNQTAINTAGSAWKKTINRHSPTEQSYRNPQYNRLLDFLREHLAKQSNIINESLGFREISAKKLGKSHTKAAGKTLADFNRFQGIVTDGLRRFKSSRSFRVRVLRRVLTRNFDFKTNVPPEYTYIILCLYIAKTYPLSAKAEFASHLEPIAKDVPAFLNKYYQALIRDDNRPIENLTCFCYTQYFWFDYRLSDSPESEIHSILFGMFKELNIRSTGDAAEIEQLIKGMIPEAEVDFPIKQLAQQVKRARQKVRKPRAPKEYDIEKELSSIHVGAKSPSRIRRVGGVSVHAYPKMHAETDLRLHRIDGEELYLPKGMSIEDPTSVLASIKEFRAFLNVILGLWPCKVNLAKIAHISIEGDYRDAHHEKGVGIIFNLDAFRKTKSQAYWIWTTARELTYMKRGRLNDTTLPLMRQLVVTAFEKSSQLTASAQCEPSPGG
jgi:hypothetical protein